MIKLVTALLIFSLTAVAQESEHQRLATELLNRWDQTQLPEFLDGKKAQIDEVMETGNRIDPIYLREILESDFNTQVVPNSSLVNPEIYSSLQTQSSLKRLVENLSNGELRPRENSERFSRFGIYLELHQKRIPQPFFWGDVEFHFDYSLLDRMDYHISPNWSHGNYNPDSASPAVSPGRTNYYIAKYLTYQNQNEVVFQNPIPLNKLVKIVVPLGKKKKLIAELVDKKIKCPVAMGWDKLIREQRMPKKKPAEPDSNGPSD